MKKKDKSYKFKSIGFTDPYDSIYSEAMNSKDPIDTLNRMLIISQSETGWERASVGTPFSSKNINAVGQLETQTQIISQIKDDVEVGTHNRKIHKLNLKLSEIIRKLDYCPLVEKPHLLARKTALKNSITRLRKLDEKLQERIRIRDEKDKAKMAALYQDMESILDVSMALYDTEPSPRNRDLYKMHRERNY